MIHVGDNITVTLLGIKAGQARIGVSAPKDAQVHREEIYRRIKNNEAYAPKTECTK